MTTILIVDDNDAMRALLRELVGLAFPACRLLEAASGESAVQLCASEGADVVILDIVMGGMSGIEAARRIKETCPGAGVVMHSQQDNPISREQSYAAGASAFIPKSESYSALVPALARLLPA